MPMLNKDIAKQNNTAIIQKISDALKANDVDGAANALDELQSAVTARIDAEFEQYKDVNDMQVLQSRGFRTLTSEENSWYQKFISAVRSGAKQEIDNMNAAMPVTIIDRVMEDMKKSHPILSDISFVDAAGAVKIVMNGIQMASKLGGWGQISSAITTQLKGGIKSIDVTAAKYTAYFLIPKDFVKFNWGFAPMWVDQYIRTMLAECVAYGLEKSILTGNGKDQFIGMIMDTTTATDGVYTEKAKVALTDFDESYVNVIAALAKDSNGEDRDVPEVLLVVNPTDYIKKIRRIQNTVVYGTGNFDMINHTYPTKVITSCMLAEGEAVVGISRNYFAAMNGGTSGIIEFSDENQFLEDNRIYTTRVYGMGRPVDNTSFAHLDISAVEAPVLPVKVKGTVTTKAAA